MANSKGDNETLRQKLYKEVCVLRQIHKEIMEYYFENPVVKPIRPMTNTKNKSWKIESKVIVSIEQKQEKLVKPGRCKTKIPGPRHEDLSKCVPQQTRDKIRGPRQEDRVQLEKPVLRKAHSRIPVLIQEDSKHSVKHFLRKTENKHSRIPVLIQEDSKHSVKHFLRKTENKHSRIPVLIQEDSKHSVKHFLRKTENKHSRIPVLIQEDSKHSVKHFLRKTENKYQEPRLEHHAKSEKFSLPRADNKIPLTPGKYHAKTAHSKIPVATWKYFVPTRSKSAHTPSQTGTPLKTMSKIPMPRHKYLTKHM